MSADRSPVRPKTPAAMQGHLFETPSTLLTIGEVEALFCDALGVHRSTFYESHRPWLPFVYTRVRPVKGEPGQFVKGSPRLREDVARELLALASNGMWAEYAMGEFAEERPHLYPRGHRRIAA